MREYRYVMVLTFRASTDEVATALVHEARRGVTNHAPKGVFCLDEEHLDQTDYHGNIKLRNVWLR